jgi:hypothetical protein
MQPWTLPYQLPLPLVRPHVAACLGVAVRSITASQYKLERRGVQSPIERAYPLLAPVVRLSTSMHFQLCSHACVRRHEHWQREIRGTSAVQGCGLRQRHRAHRTYTVGTGPCAVACDPDCVHASACFILPAEGVAAFSPERMHSAMQAFCTCQQQAVIKKVVHP